MKYTGGGGDENHPRPGLTGVLEHTQHWMVEALHYYYQAAVESAGVIADQLCAERCGLWLPPSSDVFILSAAAKQP